jgi:hypothetical protein
MQAVTTIGLDIAKSVFQVQAIDAEDNVLIRQAVRQRPFPVAPTAHGFGLSIRFWR